MFIKLKIKNLIIEFNLIKRKHFPDIYFFFFLEKSTFLFIFIILIISVCKNKELSISSAYKSSVFIVIY